MRCSHVLPVLEQSVTPPDGNNYIVEALSHQRPIYLAYIEGQEPTVQFSEFDRCVGQSVVGNFSRFNSFFKSGQLSFIKKKSFLKNRVGLQ